MGLRPGRSTLRLEVEQLEIPAISGQGAGRVVPVVHNYGHGGAGLTLGWGCAGDAAALLKSALKL